MAVKTFNREYQDIKSVNFIKLDVKNLIFKVPRWQTADSLQRPVLYHLAYFCRDRSY